MKKIIRFIYLGELRRLVAHIKKDDVGEIADILNSFKKCKFYYSCSDNIVREHAIEGAFRNANKFSHFLWIYQNSNGDLKKKAYIKARELVTNFETCKTFYSATKTNDKLLFDRCLSLFTEFNEFSWLADFSSGITKVKAVGKAGFLMSSSEQYRWVYKNSEGLLKEKALVLASRELENFDDCFWVYHASKISNLALDAKYRVIEKIKALLAEGKIGDYAC